MAENLTITYRYLSINWDGHHTLQISRTDGKGSVELSLSEWEFLLHCAELRGWPIHPPIPTPEDDPS